MKKYITKDIKNIIIYVTVSGISAAFASLIPYVTADLIENISDLDGSNIVKYTLMYIGAVAGILLLEYLTKIQGNKIVRNFLYNVRCDLFKGISYKSQSDFMKNESGYYVELLTDDINTLREDYFDTVIGFFENGIKIVVYFVCMFFLNPILSFVILTFSVISSIIPTLGGKKMSLLRGVASTASGSYLTRLKELFTNFIIVNRDTRVPLCKRHDEACFDKQKALLRFQNNRSFYEIFTGLFCYLINIATFACGIILISFDKLNPGEFVGLLAFIDILTIPVRDFSYLVIHFGASAEIKRKITNELPKDTGKAFSEIPTFRDSIKLVDVSYTRDDFTLSGISFEFKKGKKYAIIGKSGAGKSTLLKLIAGYNSLDSGSILVDGIDTDEDYMSMISSYIGQDTAMFQANGVDNATVFGSYSNDGLNDVATKIGCKDLLTADFGEGGCKISGGEKNKAALLRAFCKNSDLFLCDEMFAALDINSKRIISEIILTNPDYTVISVTHDVSDEMLGYYDVVITMEDGKIIRTETKEK